ncbi:Phosphatidylserine decarboxylase proenzyme [Paenochrobactrum sp. BZR 201-1]
MSSVKDCFVPIHKKGYPFLCLGLIATAGLSMLSAFLFWPAFIITIWVGYFFRDPYRITPVSEGIVVSPAEGRVSMITEVAPPPELGLPNEPMLRISIFMSIFDCHINRIPVSGTISRIAYKSGKFFNAELDKASDHNERNGLVVETPYGLIAVVQIAGLIARRIEHWVSENEKMEVGDRFGLIRFGSRLDVYLPLGTPLNVSVGQFAIVGETVLAHLNDRTNSKYYKTS